MRQVLWAVAVVAMVGCGGPDPAEVSAARLAVELDEKLVATKEANVEKAKADLATARDAIDAEFYKGMLTIAIESLELSKKDLAESKAKLAAIESGR